MASTLLIPALDMHTQLTISLLVELRGGEFLHDERDAVQKGVGQHRRWCSASRKPPKIVFTPQC